VPPFIFGMSLMNTWHETLWYCFNRLKDCFYDGQLPKSFVFSTVFTSQFYCSWKNLLDF